MNDEFPRQKSDGETVAVALFEAIHWVAHGNLAGPTMGPRLLVDFSGKREDDIIRESHALEGREALALDLILHRVGLGDIRIFIPRPAPVSDEGAWNAQDAGALEENPVEEVIAWIAVAWEDLVRCFPERTASARARAIESLQAQAVAAGADLFAEPLHRAPTPLASDEAHCRRWIGEQAAQGHQPKSRDEMYAEAAKKFPLLGRRAFLRCWESMAPADWKRAGRKPRLE
jgi:hypothetical protein